MKLKVDSRPEPDAGEMLVRFFSSAERTAIPAAIPELEWTAGPGATVILHHERLLCVGLGDPGKLTAQTLRFAAGAAIRTLQKSGRAKAAFDLRAYPKWIAAAAEGAFLAHYNFDDFKKTKSFGLQSLRIVVKERDVPAARKEARHGEISGTSANLARQVGNQPGNLLYPETLAAECRLVARREGLGVTVLDEKQLERGGFGGLIAVGLGSKRPPPPHHPPPRRGPYRRAAHRAGGESDYVRYRRHFNQARR